MCRAQREVLVTDTVDPWWSARARQAIDGLRVEKTFLRDEPAPLTTDGDGLTWWTYAGGSANVLLARVLESSLGGKLVARNSGISFREEAGKSDGAVREAIACVRAAGGPTDEDTVTFAKASAGRTRLSKFEGCLPEGMLLRFLADSLDVRGARATVGT